MSTPTPLEARISPKGPESRLIGKCSKNNCVAYFLTIYCRALGRTFARAARTRFAAGSGAAGPGAGRFEASCPAAGSDGVFEDNRREGAASDASQTNSQTCEIASCETGARGFISESARRVHLRGLCRLLRRRHGRYLVESEGGQSTLALRLDRLGAAAGRVRRCSNSIDAVKASHI